MKKLIFCLTIAAGVFNASIAQRTAGNNRQEAANNSITTATNSTTVARINFKTDSTVTVKNEITIRGEKVPYVAIAGTAPVVDADDQSVANVFYTYYERTDIKDKSTRPLVISFNGGPGTPSVWMEIGYTGPRILNVDDEGYPVQPYGMKD